jgi:hypothetical protein
MYFISLNLSFFLITETLHSVNVARISSNLAEEKFEICMQNLIEGSFSRRRKLGLIAKSTTTYKSGAAATAQISMRCYATRNKKVFIDNLCIYIMYMYFIDVAAQPRSPIAASSSNTTLLN